MLRVLLASLFVLSLVTSVLAAVPSRPSPLLPQPAGAPRFYTQWELHMRQVYRVADTDFRESPGGSSAASGDGVSDAGTGASSSGGSAK